ncbi:MAG: site-specific integrase, partial [Terrimicrobiaceae bacterium]
SGKQIRRMLKATDKALARRRLEELRGKIEGLRVGAKDMSFRELSETWLNSLKGGNLKPKSYARRETAVRCLLPHFGVLSVRSVTPHHCDEWKARRGVEVAARTYNIERETLRSIFEHARRDGLLLENPTRFLPRRKAEKPQLHIPTKAEFVRLVEEVRKLGGLTAEAVNFMEFLAYSGCRLAEAVGMEWGDVNFEAKTFTVTGGEQGTKNHEFRTVPLFPTLEALLLRFRGALGREPRPGERLFGIESAKTAMGSGCRKAGLAHFTHHSLRHFFCSNAIEAGIDFKVIAGWLGHKDGGVLVAKTYGHLRDEHSAAMAQRMTFEVGGGGVP